MTGNRTRDEVLFLFLEEIGKRNEISSCVVKRTTRCAHADERTPTRKVKTMSTYAVEVIEDLVDNTYSYYLEFSQLLRQWGGTLPSEKQKESRNRERDVMNAMNSMKDYAESLKNNRTLTLEQIGDEILHRAQMCIYAVLAQHWWCIEELPYRMRKCSVDNYSKILIMLLKKIKFVSYILIGCESESDFAQRYYEFVSSGLFQRYQEAIS